MKSVIPDTHWWQHRTTLFVFMLLASAPIWFTTVPPLIDFIGHIGRYRVMLEIDQSLALQRNWDFQWALIGNLGVDLLMFPLASWLGLERASWLVAAVLPALVIWGMFRVARAVHGEVPPTALAAAPFALAYPYQHGFVNYWLSFALVLHTFALWVAFDRDRRSEWLRIIVFLPIGIVVWICHVYGWGILGVFVGGYEIARRINEGDRRIIELMPRVALRCLPLLVPMVLMVIWRENGEGAATLGWFRWPHKIGSMAMTLRDQSYLLDILSVAAAVFLIYMGARDRRLAFDSKLGIPSLLFLVLVIVIPFQLFGSAFADSRLWPVIFVTTLLALRVQDAERGIDFSRRIAFVAVSVFVVRIAAGAIGFAEYDRAYSRHLLALDFVERGSKVAVLNALHCDVQWRRPRLDHLGSAALIRRDAFVNSQWDVPGGQLLVPLGAKGTTFNADPSQFVFDDCAKDLRPELKRRIDSFPRERFDYLWVFGFDPRTLPADKGLRKLYADDATILYQILSREDS